MQQLYRDFVEHETTGRPIDEVVAARLKQRSRRDFLQFATVGAAATLARPAKAFAAAPRIAIVGGGIAAVLDAI